MDQLGNEYSGKENRYKDWAPTSGAQEEIRGTQKRSSNWGRRTGGKAIGIPEKNVKQVEENWKEIWVTLQPRIMADPHLWCSKLTSPTIDQTESGGSCYHTLRAEHFCDFSAKNL